MSSGYVNTKDETFSFFLTKTTAWNNKLIDAGETSNPVSSNNKNIHIFFISDTTGYLTIEIPDPAGSWHTYDSFQITANQLTPYVMTAKTPSLRIKYDTASVVTAWYYLTGD